MPNCVLMIKGLIFDLDGVLVDTAKYHYLAWRKLAMLLGFEFSEEDNEPLKGISRMASLEHLLKLGNIEASFADKEKYCIAKNNWYLEYTSDMNADELLSGALDLILLAKKIGLKIALGSASKNARPILEKTNIQVFFDAIVDGNDVVNSKPDPEVFLKAAAALRLQPEECLVLEDSEKGIDAAISGGFYAVGVGKEENLGHAHKVVGSLEALDLNQIVRSDNYFAKTQI